MKINDVVLIENDNVKRINWPIGRVMELMPGKDGHVRLVRVKTEHGELLRPVRRLFLLERAGVDEDKEKVPIATLPSDSSIKDATQASTISGRSIMVTRSGRVTKQPQRY